ncbi:hypothetical protein CKAN_01444200 [Cinnamomum micranthum f. kanehirae]|uniref:Retrotransposon Copia-like N-terminal domain-containing protein n=1 Tax=Cinnamomum micranthum f. kanehirae TaxID=337451 RepID=A0A3S3QJW2_9MAGN|nr:hypothetical protein CKAN_01444200 [Cinnamomum micranthum f. kanehirae]
MDDTTKKTAKTYSNDVGDPMDNPSYTHHSDSPTAILVSPPLTGDNYSTWVRAMRMALRAKNKLGFVTGDITEPSSPSQIPQWERCNDLVTSWILRSLHPDLASSVLYGKTAKDVWEDLSDRFHQPNAPRLFQIKQQISSLRQDKLSVSTYFTRLKALWDEQSSITSLPPCSCGTVKSASELIQQDRVMQFLQGLHESFSTLRSNILLIEPFPSVNKVYSLVSQEEKQRELNISHISSIEASALVTKRTTASDFQRWPGNNSRENATSRSNKNCRYCRRDGHTIEECYKLHGYPSRKPNNGKPLQNRVNHAAATPLHVDGSLLSESQPSNQVNQEHFQNVLAMTSTGPCHEEDDWTG